MVPLVFYQQEPGWMYSTEFADLFEATVREWPGVPRFAQGPLDQSQMAPGSSPRARVDGLFAHVARAILTSITPCASGWP